MKIRNGFVSNSSSSSFLAYGITSCDNSLKQWEELFHKLHNGSVDFEGEIETFSDDYTIYFARPFLSIKEDETYGEFKKKAEKDIVNTIKKVRPEVKAEDFKFDIIDVATYDG